MSRRADGGLAVPSRRSRDRSDPGVAPSSRVFTCSQCGPGHFQDSGLRGSWHFFSGPRGLYRTVWGGAAWNCEARAGWPQGRWARTVHVGGRLASEPLEKLGPREDPLSPSLKWAQGSSLGLRFSPLLTLFFCLCPIRLSLLLTFLLYVLTFVSPSLVPLAGHLQTPHQAAGQPFKFTIPESLDRIKEEFQFLQAQYHRCVSICLGWWSPVGEGGVLSHPTRLLGLCA